VAAPETTPELKEKLELVLAARRFGRAMGLKLDDSFKTFSMLDRPVLAWVLAASRKDKFELYTWWFPFVGRVPYKGFFDKKDAQCAALELETKGFEIWLRPTDAFSTLGWFDDPLLSTTLNRSAPVIVATVLHEATHSTLWRKDDVEFNESLAHFVGLQGAVEFFSEQVRRLCPDSPLCEKHQQWLAEAQKIRDSELALAPVVNTLYTQLEELYRSSFTSEEKIKQREGVLKEVLEQAGLAKHDLGILKRVNNAEIVQLRLYLGRLAYFAAAYSKADNDWHKMLRHLSSI
jgi:predicted aminopeptidase